MQTGSVPTPQKAVLVVYTARRDSVTPAVSDAIFSRVIGDGVAGHLDYNPEYLDIARFQEPEYQEAARQFLRAKYHGQKFDLLLAVGDSALAFLTRFRHEVASVETPLIFGTIRRPSPAPNSTGFIAPYNLKASLDTALALQPETQRVVVVVGSSAFDHNYEVAAREAFKPLEGRLTFTYLNGLPIRDIYHQVSTLPPHSIVFFTSLTEDSERQRFPPVEIIDRVTAVANAPVYTWVSYGVGHGVVGGRMASQEVFSARLADLAVRVLQGEPAASIPVMEIDRSVTQFDWRQLRRWGISEARLPAGSVVLFRPPSAWELYKPYIVGGILLMLVQTAYTAALFVQGRRRRRAEVALRESEGRFHLMADTAPVLIWRAATDKKCDFFNRPWLEFTGRTLEQELGDGWVEGVHPDDLENCVSIYSSSFDARLAFQMEYRLRRHDGEYRWLLDNGVPRHRPDGGFDGYIGSCIDISDRKEAEGRLQESQRQQQRLAGWLITAQEYERARIARDLHDDINQQLASLAISLSNLKHRVASSSADGNVAGALSSLQEQTTTVVENIRHLSQGLHPTALQHAGLVPALAAHCRELERQQALTITLSSSGALDGMDSTAALCLFRVAQEALRNVSAHAEASCVSVHVNRVGDSAEITIEDDGLGFDVGQVRRGSEGLGLVSIQERARLAGGKMSLLTEIGGGTLVRVRIPVTIADQGAPRQEPGSASGSPHRPL